MTTIVIGGGLAGLSAALALAPAPVLLFGAAACASAWAQGGIAAALGPDDSPALHAADTCEAGDGLCDPAVATRITAAGPGLIGALRASGVRFDPALGLEAAHGRRRIVHAGDSTGAAVVRVLVAQARATPSITMRHDQVRRLILRDGAVAGVVLADGTAVAAPHVVLATGGVGGLYAQTTNPLTSWGQGLLLAARAGAMLSDLEFIQFHPTALDVGRDPMPLVSEAVRGEGAVLINDAGQRFMTGQGREELAPRDVVARAVSAQAMAGHAVLLDARAALGPRFAARFPTVAGFCASAGIDPATQPIPVQAAAHFHMGGIVVDADGRTSVPGLFACGECAATGLHGANRLASNSLLEAGVCGAAVAAAIKGEAACRIIQVANAAPLPPADPGPVRAIMGAGLGVLRNAAGMERAVAALLRLAQEDGPAAEPACVALAIAVSALGRRESRGAHARTDFPQAEAAGRRSRITLPDVFTQAREVAWSVA